ncbi:MAG: universal stress protein [Paraburkholderia sp.]|uniref:universal stress protein n=1 Tax=Paraburkholderia sp. TaxID=1926495 RepID=UPI003C4586AA
MYQKILVPVDGSETSRRALNSALQLAHDTGAELQPLFVVDPPLFLYDTPLLDPFDARDALRDEGAHLAEDALSRMRRASVAGTPRIVEADVVAADDVAHCILRAAKDFKADVVVMGTHGRQGFRRLMLGSVAENFLRIAECAVLMIPAHCDKPQVSVTQCACEAVKELS